MSAVSIDKEPVGSAKPGFITRIPTDDTLPRWRAWVARHPVGGALLAGAVATQFATVFGIWFPGFGLPHEPYPSASWNDPILLTCPFSPTTSHVTTSLPDPMSMDMYTHEDVPV